MVPRVWILSGLREQSVQEYIGFGTPGAVLHGIIGIKIDVINVAADITPEYITFFFNCMILLNIQSL